MISWVHKTLSLAMAVMVLLSTMAWTVDKHLCMGRVMDISVFSEAQDCGMGYFSSSLRMDGMEDHCCDDESFTFQGQDDLKSSLYDFELIHQVVLTVFAFTYFNPFSDLRELQVPNEEYPPPKLVRDIQVLHEVFLI
ncbi:MAG: hypothetical protein AAGB24_07820 [Bacteroidota bacterium]